MSAVYAKYGKLINDRRGVCYNPSLITQGENQVTKSLHQKLYVITNKVCQVIVINLTYFSYI